MPPTVIGQILAALDERQIAREVTLRHDEARIRFPLRHNTAGSWEQFTEIIADYYNYHFGACVAYGGTMPRSEAASRAKEILEREYRRHGNNAIVAAYNDAHDGTNGGMRALLDKLAEAAKAEAVERYIRDVFDRYVAPVRWEDKVEIIRQFIAQCGAYLASSMDANDPKRYADNYNELIRAYVRGLQSASSIFRRV
jgi:hypothetical protein